MDIHVDEVGVILELLISSGVDISTATDLQIILQTPTGSNISKTATFTTDGSDGLIRYTILLADLNRVGVWKIRGKYTLGAAKKNTTWAVISVFN